MATTNPCLSPQCISQIPGTENKMSYLLSILCPLVCEKEVTLGLVEADGSAEIPEGSQTWSLSVVGDNATVNGTALPDGSRLSGSGPLAVAMTLEAGAATTITYSYESCTGTNTP